LQKLFFDGHNGSPKSQIVAGFLVGSRSCQSSSGNRFCKGSRR
jgi:hypothetical protein